MKTPEPSQIESWCRRLEQIFVPAIADVLDSLGHRQQCLRAGLWPLLPGQVAAGPAFTVREVAAPTEALRSQEEKRRIFAEFFGALQPGQVIMVDTGQCYAAAAWGELMSTISRFTCGVRAAVVDGAIRDVSRIEQLEFPVWYVNRMPADSDGRLQLLDFNQPIRCGGVEVLPGDIVFGDPDGVVVIPIDGRLNVEALITQAESFVHLEDRSRADLRAGKSVTEVFNTYGRL